MRVFYSPKLTESLVSVGEAEKAVPTGKITDAVSKAANIVSELVSTGTI